MKEFRIPPKLAIINDLSGYGRCSLAAAVPVVSTMGVQACPVPTALFSNHMGFPVYCKTDCTPMLKQYLACWEKLNIGFDGILCGFLGSEAQIPVFCEFIEKQKTAAHSLIVTDPVMGDHGKLYSSVSATYADALKELLAHTDILTPNLTEACLLTGTAYPAAALPAAAALHDTPSLPDEAFLASLADKLHRLGPSHIVITGIQSAGFFHNYISVRGGGSAPYSKLCATPSGGVSRPGTGDIFVSVLTARLLRNDANPAPAAFTAAVKKAAEFVRVCTEGSAAASVPVKEGVCFENYLGLLAQCP